MNELARRILFNNLQLSKGNRNKKIEKTLMNDVMAFKKLPSIHDFNVMFDSLFENKMMREKFFSGNYFPKYAIEFQNAWEIPFSGNIYFELRWILKNIEKNQEAML